MGKKQSYSAQITLNLRMKAQTLFYTMLYTWGALWVQGSHADTKKVESQMEQSSDSAPTQAHTQAQIPSIEFKSPKLAPVEEELEVKGVRQSNLSSATQQEMMRMNENIPTVDLSGASTDLIEASTPGGVKSQDRKSEEPKKEELKNGVGEKAEIKKGEIRKERIKKEGEMELAIPQFDSDKQMGHPSSEDLPSTALPAQAPQSGGSSAGSKDLEKPAEGAPPRELHLTPSCGMIADLLGDVQVLDQSRTQLLNLGPHDLIPCGSWISSHAGWVAIQHKLGAKVHLGQETYLQVREGMGSAGGVNESGAEHLSVLRGEVYVEVGGGNPELRIASASARVRVSSGKAIFLVGYLEDRTQLMVLERSAQLENRFEPRKAIEVAAGETSELILQNDRVIPQIPSAVALSSLEPKFLTLRIPQAVQTAASQEVRTRQSRKMAAQLIEPSGSKKTREPQKKREGRALASARSMNSYLKNPPSAQDPYLKNHFVKSVVGDEQAGRAILFPYQYQGKRQSVGIQVEEKKYAIPGSLAERNEKKRLIEELGRIKFE